MVQGCSCGNLKCKNSGMGGHGDGFSVGFKELLANHPMTREEKAVLSPATRQEVLTLYGDIMSFKEELEF